jgi:hypothetical protein
MVGDKATAEDVVQDAFERLHRRCPTGVHVLMQCNNFGRLDGNHFTPLPGLPPSSADNYSATAAW